MKKFTHEWIEKNPWLLIGLVILVISFGGLVEIVPLFFQKSTTEPVAGLKPYSPLRLAGRDIYIREGCYNCHSQMIRPFRAETERTGPDLARVGGRYSDEWHRTHLDNPRDVVPESNMPGYPWLARTKLVPAEIVPKMHAMRTLAVPYTDDDIRNAPAELANKTEQDALIAYLQGLGTQIKTRN